MENLISKIENEYPGFREKTIDHNDLYINLKTRILLKSDSINDLDCIKVLNDYTSFFKDEHIYLQVRTKSNEENTIPSEQKQDKPEVDAEMLASNIFYIKISSFRYENIVPVKELVEHHQKQIEKARALIIDVRDNFGGTDDVYQPLLPYILTNPLRIMNVEFFSTNTLINGLRDYAIQNIKEDSLNQLQEIENDLKIYKDSLGKFVLYGNQKSRSTLFS
ncbi:MAG: hypothetical protein KL787_07050 [Taibaiella sp.]|nr:hypothetical protein [Taibaiella sp.]